jgi:hypothetical protein
MTALSTDDETSRREASKFENLESRTWFTGQQRARYLGLSEGTENRYQKLGIGPRAIKIGNGSRSRRDWCDEWILEGGITRPDRAAILKTANAAAHSKGGHPNVAASHADLATHEARRAKADSQLATYAKAQGGK